MTATESAECDEGMPPLAASSRQSQRPFFHLLVKTLRTWAAAQAQNPAMKTWLDWRAARAEEAAAAAAEVEKAGGGTRAARRAREEEEVAVVEEELFFFKRR